MMRRVTLPSIVESGLILSTYYSIGLGGVLDCLELVGFAKRIRVPTPSFSVVALATRHMLMC